MSEPATEKLAVVIVDDEAPARSLLREQLATHADVDVVAECANGFEAVKAVAAKARSEQEALEKRMAAVEAAATRPQRAKRRKSTDSDAAKAK